MDSCSNINPTKNEIVGGNLPLKNKISPKDPNLLDTIARRYRKKIVGEDKKVKTLVCCLLSKDLPRKYRTSIVISNQSSTGKSHLLNNVLEPFRNPENPLLDPVVDYTDFTEAHFKRSQSDVNGKIIKLEQLERRDDKGKLSFQKTKHLLSEGRLKFGNVDTTEKGQKIVKDFEIVGVPVIVTTVTEYNIDEETANRMLIMQLDESEDQTKRIMDYTLSEYADIPQDKNTEDVEDLREIFNGMKVLAQHIDAIVIPFADKLKEILPKNLEMRRDLKKVLNLACIIAFIHALNRDCFRSKKTKQFFTGDMAETKEQNTFVIVVKPEDFILAMEIAGDAIKQTINKSSQKLIEVDELLRTKFNAKALHEQGGITVKELMKDLGLSENRTREYLNQLCDKSLAWKDDSQKEHQYFPSEKKFSELDPTQLVFSDEEYKIWKRKQEKIIGEDYVFVPSCDASIEFENKNESEITPEHTPEQARDTLSC